VELLVVIGIIAVLVGILLPALGKARRSAQGAACLSNLRQLSNAVVMYASENNQWMPAAAGSSDAEWNSANSVNGSFPFPTNPTTGRKDTSYTANWIAWYREVDPVTGQNNFPGGDASAIQDQNITYSGLAKYLAIPLVTTAWDGQNGLPNSNTISGTYDHVFICPGDDRTDRPNGRAGNVYRYSYSMNGWISLPPKNRSGQTAPTGVNANTARVWGTFNGKITSIRQPSNIVLFICEDSQTLDDGIAVLDAWAWSKPPGSGEVNTVSPRHTSGARSANQTTATAAIPGYNQDGYGNASFCDGHAEIVSRKDVLRAVHSGNWDPDPVGTGF
jgi:prepilin-type processing-associated H-X9-DG protein